MGAVSKKLSRIRGRDFDILKANMRELFGDITGGVQGRKFGQGVDGGWRMGGVGQGGR